jgi:hypothetical protein
MTNLIKEFNKYKYPKNNNFRDTSDHMADALRYSMLTNKLKKDKFYKSLPFWVIIAVAVVISLILMTVFLT